MSNIQNIRIQGIEIYHPDKLVTNEYLIKKFREEQGKEIERLLISMGRNERYFADDDPNETSLTMGYKAAKKVMESCNLTGDDIDLIIFSSQTPEYLCPPNSVLLSDMLHLKNSVQMFDQNVNCLGMVSATITIRNMMAGNPNIKRALLVGSDNFTSICTEDNEYTYPVTADLGCALVFERSDDENSGFIGHGASLSDCSLAFDAVRYPRNGMKKSFEDSSYDRKSFWPKPLDIRPIDGAAKKLFFSYCDENGIDFKSIDHFCMSQFNHKMILNIIKSLGIDPEKYIYIGDKYGYTGTSSPFVALWYGIKTGKIKRGDLIGLWSLGLWWTTAVILFRY
ncbi:MAG: 3-oxoacyl-ACP synthase III family protein [Acutalibacteraceae bacterium]